MGEPMDEQDVEESYVEFISEIENMNDEDYGNEMNEAENSPFKEIETTKDFFKDNGITDDVLAEDIVSYYKLLNNATDGDSNFTTNFLAAIKVIETSIKTKSIDANTLMNVYVTMKNDIIESISSDEDGYSSDNYYKKRNLQETFEAEDKIVEKVNNEKPKVPYSKIGIIQSAFNLISYAKKIIQNKIAGDLFVNPKDKVIKLNQKGQAELEIIAGNYGLDITTQSDQTKALDIMVDLKRKNGEGEFNDFTIETGEFSRFSDFLNSFKDMTIAESIVHYNNISKATKKAVTEAMLIDLKRKLNLNTEINVSNEIGEGAADGVYKALADTIHTKPDIMVALHELGHAMYHNQLSTKEAKQLLEIYEATEGKRIDDLNSTSIGNLLFDAKDVKEKNYLDFSEWVANKFAEVAIFKYIEASNPSNTGMENNLLYDTISKITDKSLTGLHMKSISNVSSRNDLTINAIITKNIENAFLKAEAVEINSMRKSGLARNASQITKGVVINVFNLKTFFNEKFDDFIDLDVVYFNMLSHLQNLNLIQNDLDDTQMNFVVERLQDMGTLEVFEIFGMDGLKAFKNGVDIALKNTMENSIIYSGNIFPEYIKDGMTYSNEHYVASIENIMGLLETLSDYHNKFQSTETIETPITIDSNLIKQANLETSMKVEAIRVNQMGTLTENISDLQSLIDIGNETGLDKFTMNKYAEELTILTGEFKNLKEKMNTKKQEITVREAVEIAKDLGVDYRNLENYYIQNGIDETTLAAAQILLNRISSEKLKIFSKMELEGETPVLRLKFAVLDLNATRTHAFLQDEGKTLGRSIQVLNNIEKYLDGSELDDYRMGKIEEELNKAPKEKREKMLNALKNLDTTNKVDVEKVFKNFHKVDKWGGVYYWWIASILSGTKTLVKNLGGTFSSAGYSLYDSQMSVVIDNIKSKLVDDHTRTRFSTEVKAEAIGMVSSLSFAMEEFKRVMAGDVSQYNKYTERLDKPDFFKNTKLGRIMDLPLRTLSATDTMFQALLYKGTIHKLSSRAARVEAIKNKIPKNEMQNYILSRAEKIAEGDIAPEIYQKMLQEAEKRMLEYTYNSELTGTLKGLLSTRDMKIPDEVYGVGGLKPLFFFFPFVRTPTNIAIFNMKRSPLGLMYELSKIKKNGIDVDELGKAIGGTLLFLFFATLHSLGIIQGGAPQEFKEREVYYNNGNIPYSICGYTYNNVEPFGSMMAISADIMQSTKDLKEISASNFIKNSMPIILKSFSKNMADQTFFRGIGDVLDFIKGEQSLKHNSINSIVSGLIPMSGSLNSVNSVTDNKYREYNNPIEYIRSRLPFVSKSLESKKDSMGRERKRTGNFITRLFTPTTFSNTIPEEGDKMLKQLGLTISKPTKTTGNITMSDKNYNLFLKERGKAINALGERLNKSNSSEERKRKYVSKKIPEITNKIKRRYNRKERCNNE